MARSRSSEFLEKSVSAMITAIETYNKPDHKYREETFSILALNAWELLLKSKILAEKNNDMRELYIYECRRRKDGTLSTKKYIKRNRARNPMTIGIGKALSKIQNEKLAEIDPVLIANLEALIEIRDNSIHFINMSEDLSKVVQEVGMATLQNYVQVVTEWFGYDLSQYNFYLMPLAFFRNFDSASIERLTKEEINVAKYLSNISYKYDNGSNENYAVTLELNVRLKRSALPTAARLALGNNPDAVPITFTEEDIRAQYPWDYGQLTDKLRDRYSDFKVNKDYHSIRKKSSKDKRYVMSRYLDPDNKNSAKKDFFSPNILNEFDKYYNRK
ncbi:DUF3644 domain-containing protein [Clostridium sp. Cult2]|uniref:DUF3644 domain-containing protein n=1 Tax=Clostridium sp. Cult2 TaxID=2079003 RepID=UPI001F198DAD|nr:DUF3644 domain-containing protein [Clostridium sp. Cult2]MCF6466047.1 DUF3644 domain-containing protein [Clostridium sp. Cult2]